jgi:hypothetical protein
MTGGYIDPIDCIATLKEENERLQSAMSAPLTERRVREIVREVLHDVGILGD